jgi:AbrB family looped-hinge helix DNA binding protein
MPTVARLTTRHQIAVPVEVRRMLGLEAGDRVEFRVEGSTATLRKAEREPSDDLVLGLVRGTRCAIGTCPRTTRHSATFRREGVLEISWRM